MDGGLDPRERATVRALIVPVLGVPDEPVLIDRAVERLDAFLRCIPEEGAAKRVHELLFVLRWKSKLENWGKAPEELSPARMKRFVRKLFSSDDTRADWFFDRATQLAMLFGHPELPSIRDLAKSIREMLSLAYWTNPETDGKTGYVPVWNRDDIWRDRADVDPTRRPKPLSGYIDVHAARGVHRVGHPYDTRRLFRGDAPGRKVAVIGSGAGGAVVAAHLAAEGWDVAVFEAGPRFRPSEYPLDALVGMAQLFEKGLLTLNHNLDIHLLRGRLVGGGTVLTSGMSIQMWPEVLARWNSDHGAGLPQDEMWAAFEEVKKRIALDLINPALLCDPGEAWKRGGERINAIREKTIAVIVEQYLHGGACEVGLAGVRRMNDRSNWFRPTDPLPTEREIRERLAEMIPTAEHVMLSSAHPQGGLCMGSDPDRHAVEPSFRLRGTDNLFVADASVFPETITVNPQWTVMAVATVAARRIQRQLASAPSA